MIHILSGDATYPVGEGKRYIAHVCNDSGGWGKGFVEAISLRWHEPEREFRRKFRTQGLELGEIQVVQVEPTIWVVNMIGQKGTKVQGGVPPVRYGAINRCLFELARVVKENGGTIHMPRIGCGLAGGTWGHIEPLINQQLHAHEVYVYDYAPHRAPK